MKNLLLKYLALVLFTFVWPTFIFTWFLIHIYTDLPNTLGIVGLTMLSLALYTTVIIICLSLFKDLGIKVLPKVTFNKGIGIGIYLAFNEKSFIIAFPFCFLEFEIQTKVECIN